MKKTLALLVAIMMMVMAIPAMADSFVPSIAGKPAPAVKEGSIVIVKADGTTVTVPFHGLVVTALSEINDATDPATVAFLKWAYDHIMNDGHHVLEDEINQLLAGTGLTFADLVVRDLFEVSAYGDYAVMMDEEGVHAEFDLLTGFEPGETVVVIYSFDATEWHVLPEEKWEMDEEGHVSLTMEKLGVIAFMVVGEVENLVMSPAN